MTSTPTPKIRKRGVVAVIARGDELLVIRRSATVAAPLKFGFPGGGIEHAETEPEALVRECQEELNAAVRPIGRLWHNVTSWGVSLAWWEAEFLPGEQPVANPLEVDSLHWLTPPKILALEGLLESNHHFMRSMADGTIRLTTWKP